MLAHLKIYLEKVYLRLGDLDLFLLRFNRRMGIFLDVYEIRALQSEFVTRQVLDSISIKLGVLTTSLHLYYISRRPSEA